VPGSQVIHLFIIDYVPSMRRNARWLLRPTRATFDAVYIGKLGKRTETYRSAINNSYLLPAMACGAATGLPFIPLSYIFEESPVYLSTP